MSRLRLHSALLLLLALAACAADPPSRPLDPSALRRPEPIRAEEDPRVRPHLEQMQRVEALLQRWDALRADGRNPEAEALEPRIRQEIDGSFATFERAARGELGLHAQYLAVSALGFSANPRATAVLVARLRDRDAQLAGNALIALGVRADAATPQEALLPLIAPGMPAPVKRYAPLALANVMEARARAGRPAEVAAEQAALAALGRVVLDPDPIVRLHVAKALGAMRAGETYAYLGALSRDPTMRVRWAAAAALERQGDPRGFPDVIRLLAEVAPESRPVIRDVLVSYAARLQGRPLTPQEIESLGIGPRAWGQWYQHWQKIRGG